MLFYFLRGNLPWQGLPAKTKDEKYRKIKDKKIETQIDVLCQGFPDEFATYLQYVRSLRFQDRPDYAYLKGLFSERYAAEGFDKEESTFDWTPKIREKERSKQGSSEDAGTAGVAATPNGAAANGPADAGTNEQGNPGSQQNQSPEPKSGTQPAQPEPKAEPKKKKRGLFGFCSKGASDDKEKKKSTKSETQTK